MKRIDIEPDERSLVELLKVNPIGRNKELGSFAELLGDTEGAFTFFVDSEWGNGKTIFVRQLKLLLEAANPQLDGDADIERLISENSDLRAFNELSSFLPVYYNAWENDYWDDPLPTLAACIAAAADEEPDFKLGSSIADKVTSILDASSSIAFQMSGFGKLKGGWSSADLVRSFHERDLVRERVSGLVSTVKAERADTILLIVDELDRCKPNFALRVLEEIKNLFSDDGLIVLCSVNVRQLAHTVAGVYGPGTDGERYLARFYDLKLSLRKVDPACYMSLQGMPRTEYYFDKIVIDMVGLYGMTMRDANRYRQMIGDLREIVLGDKSNDEVSALFGSGFAPIVLAIKLTDLQGFEMVSEELSIEPFKDVWHRCPEAHGYFRSLVSRRISHASHKDEQYENLDQFVEKLVQCFVDYVWDSDRQSQRVLEARNEIMLGSINHSVIEKIADKIR